MRTVSKLYDDLYRTTNASQCWQRFIQHSSDRGLNVGLLVLLEGNKLSEDSRLHYLGNLPADIIQAYQAAGGVLGDPSLQRMQHHGEYVVPWHELPQHLQDTPQKNANLIRQVYLLGPEYGLQYGFSVFPIHSGYNPLLAVGLGHQNTKDSAPPHKHSDRPWVLAACSVLSMALKRFPLAGDNGLLPAPQLSHRQIQLLTYLASGYRLQCIADKLLFRSIHTLNKDIQQIKEHLGASTLVQCVAIAMHLNVIG